MGPGVGAGTEGSGERGRRGRTGLARIWERARGPAAWGTPVWAGRPDGGAEWGAAWGGGGPGHWPAAGGGRGGAAGAGGDPNARAAVTAPSEQRALSGHEGDRISRLASAGTRSQQGEWGAPPAKPSGRGHARARAAEGASRLYPAPRPEASERLASALNLARSCAPRPPGRP